ncbi:hypothetical protein FT663_02578 [Candidozyma haemuli var. vulneris]|uniref:Uncharacterized protein n=1 Tax=Candidozyma haemuli TaxID=45357 RepID=A0A2V1AZY4_9ASCO|nr:hypothetical protein CXQ85_005020 [[Candida] haemuloni]KAF3986710.1 hypothetical protein FT662_04410 [[Candida] haemuloni var. vulneris]KAF3991827.1 hypothetical protein FT663_02578 [[Candida] haemuloni var. vulneris]PVH22451.1 hypothetical protein CXQ85_005020 [[Candida] haemuloni]
MKISFNEVIGTSATDPQHVAFSGSKLAYVASGGVIVCEVDAKSRTLSKQRLFVANSGVSEAQNDDYVSRAFSGSDRGDGHDKRDNFDIPLESTYTYGKERIEADRKKAGGEKGDSSPSKLKDRVRAISCVALSPNGRVLAVGESGYQPRILLYSLASNASGSPFAVIHEHTFGVKHIAFSPDSRHFASLGQLSDGFLHIWKYSATSVALKAGNKCSSIVNSIFWHSSSSIVTAGLRFLKVWSFEAQESNRTVVLKGRNVVLRENLEVDFTEAVSLSSDEVLLSGCHQALYVLSLSGLSLVPVEVPDSPPAIYGLESDATTEKICYFDGHEPKLVGFDQLKRTANKSAPSSPSKIASMFSSLSLKSSPPDHPVVKSHLSFKDGESFISYLTNKKEICVYDTDSGSHATLVAAPVTRAGGMKQASNGDLLVYSKCGNLRAVEDGSIRQLASVRLPQTDQLENELNTVDYDGTYAYFGDRYGQLSVVDCESGDEVLQLKAHSSSINDLIRFHVDSLELLCTTSRDRTVQLFYKTEDKWELLQTIANHTGNLLFAKVYEESLYVCSADRSISIYGFRESRDNETPLEVIQKRVLTLKHSPTAMAILDKELHVATNDKSVHVYDASTADFKYTVKVTNENGDSLCVENFASFDRAIAVSSNDRSIRLFTPNYAKQLAVSWGHSDTILNMVGKGSSLYSIGLDGSLFIWNITDGAESNHSSFKEEDSDSSIPEPDNSPLFAKVTRKILPVASASSKPLASQSTPKIDRESSPPKRASVILDPSSPSPAPTATPRLTNATLKRMEARKQSSPSPSRSSPPKNISPSRTQSPSRTTSRSSGPFRSSTSPTKQPSFDSITNPQPRLAPQSGSDSMDRATAYISIIKSHAQKGLFTTDEKTRLVGQLNDLVNVLGGSSSSTSQEALLEKFSEQLVEIVQKKLDK